MERLVQQAAKLFDVHLTGKQLVALEIFEKELIAWNKKFNLTAIRDMEGIRIKHFLDSISCVLAWKRHPPKKLIDIGTGAGFPGIPLKILYPSMQLTLVESVGKKANFCMHMVEILHLEKTEVVYARAEEVGHMHAHRESYDWALARAVANLPVLVEYLLPLVQVGGAMLAQKGQSGPAEAHNADAAINILGGRIRSLIPIQLPGVADDRFLVVVDKVATTPPEYPRKPGIPAIKTL